jgi:hypothetical protein
MATRRTLLSAASLFGVRLPSAQAQGLDLRRIRPAVFSSGQSQTGQGGASPERVGPRDTDTAARMPNRLFMFRTEGAARGNILEGVFRVTPRSKRPVRRFDPALYLGVAAYCDQPGETLNAATPFLFALAARLDARGLIPNGLFGFTCWQGGTPLNAFLPPDDPEYSNSRAADLDGDGHGDPATNYQNLVDAIARYAELTRAEGLQPYVPLVRFEHGEGRIAPRAHDSDVEPEIARYVAAHIRMTDRLCADVRRLTNQMYPPLVLLGGWGGSDITLTLESVAHEAVRRLVAVRPDRYIGPTSMPYMAPLYRDSGPTSVVHPGFVGRIIIGEMQAHVADLCLDAGLRPIPGGFAPLRCKTLLQVDGVRYDLVYQRPPAAAGPLTFAVDDWLPATENNGFEYLGGDSDRTAVVATEVIAPDRVRVTLSRPAGDPRGQIAYGFLPRRNPLADGEWNLRGNLVCPTALPFFYAGILAAPPYDLELPPVQRYPATLQRIALSDAVTGIVRAPRRGPKPAPTGRRSV